MKSYSSNERRYIAVALLLFVLLIYIIVKRALSVPITHDESDQILYYAQQSIYDIFMYTNPWPTNHILNSLLIKLSTAIFGINQWSGRLPNIIIAVTILFGSVYAIARQLFGFKVIGLFVSVSLLLFNPYLFEFFSLARGYGMAISFSLLCYALILRFNREETVKTLLFFSLSAILMVLSNFSWLLLFCAFYGYLFLYLIYKKEIKKVLLLGLTLFFSSLVFYHPILQMNSTNQFIYWEHTDASIIKQTFHSIWSLYNYYDTFISVKIAIWLMGLITGTVLVLYFRAVKSNQDVGIYFAAPIFVFTIAVNLLQHKILNTPYLEGRTALGYWIVFQMVTIGFLYFLYKFKKSYFTILSVSIVVLMTYHFYQCTQFNFIKEWEYDKNTFQVLEICKRKKTENKPLKLVAHWYFTPSLTYYITAEKLDWLQLYKYEDDTTMLNSSKLFYTQPEYKDKAIQSNYVVIDSFDNTRFVLEQTNALPD